MLLLLLVVVVKVLVMVLVAVGDGFGVVDGGDGVVGSVLAFFVIGGCC